MALPSPEEVYAQGKKRVPSISLATVYKNIPLFVESGVFREGSMQHGLLRVECDESHHHMVCSKGKAITDIGEEEPDGVAAGQAGRRFLMEWYAEERFGICAKCHQA